MIERRAVFVTIPPLLSDIVAEVARDGISLNVVAQFTQRAGLAEQLPALAPDLVVVGLIPGEAGDIGDDILKLVPAAQVLVLSNDGRYGYLHEMRPHRTMLRDFSPADLLALLGAGDSAAPSGAVTQTI